MVWERRRNGCGAAVMSAVLLVGVVSAVSVRAETEGLLPPMKLSAAATLDVYSRYVWRGFTLDTDAVVQPGVSIGGYGLTVFFWGSFDAQNSDWLSSDELDTVIDYTFAFESVTVSLGHTYYDFPGTKTYSKEVYLGFALPEAPLSPSLKYFHDYADEDSGGDGDYILAAIAYSLPLVEAQGITLDLSASLGFNRELFIEGDGGDAGLAAGIGLPLTGNLKLTPKIGYAIPFGDLEDAQDGNQKARFYSGISLAGSF
ncbi:MAG: hypothetical protein NC924_04940 [Candidatus Omnitrophica bacterium]|nr:hypothetical protein [Candidatus Omnitrophota bacterium]